MAQNSSNMSPRAFVARLHFLYGMDRALVKAHRLADELVEHVLDVKTGSCTRGE
jgi:hypothetical protein